MYDPRLLTEDEELMEWLGICRRGMMRMLLVASGLLVGARGCIEAAADGDEVNAAIMIFAGLYCILLGFNGKKESGK